MSILQQGGTERQNCNDEAATEVETWH